LPLVSVLIPLYQEPYRIIHSLASRLLDQTYPHHRLEIVFVTEPDDASTNRYAGWVVEEIRGKFADVKHIVTDGGKKMKPYALNYALPQCSGDIVGVYDAECEPEPSQIERAVSAIFEQGYDLVQARTEVVSQNLLGELYKLDVYMWHEVFLPVINQKANSFPLGTKNLFIKKDCLEEIDGFPLHLTEDAMMSILLASRRKKFGLLDSSSREISAKTLRTHFKQRRRWFRGYLSCLWELLKINIPLKSKFWLAVPYISPILCSMTFIGFLSLILYFLTWSLAPDMVYKAPWMLNIVYGKYLFYWSLFLGFIGLPLSVVSYLYSIADTPMEKKIIHAHLIPFYWAFVGVSALACFFKTTKTWDKTKREV